jgi:DNA-binding MarR family transcriptional regulator
LQDSGRRTPIAGRIYVKTLNVYTYICVQMELEKEIKQEKFRSEHQKMVINILFTGSWLETRNSRFLKPYGISPQQFNILRILKGQHPQPASVNTLTERMIDKMSNASRLVEKLRQKGLVDRQQSAGDRRAVEVAINKKGLSLLSSIDLEEDMRNLFSGITVKDAKLVNEVLDRLRK